MASSHSAISVGPERLNDAVIATWARILHDVPDARLVLNSVPFREPAFRDLIAARFAAQGIERDRLELIATAPQSATWAAYGGIDIALDPFPHNAGTTTIEALWQGVPVVSLAGRPSVGRFGAMILHAVGMDDWVSADVDGYIARARRRGEPTCPALAQAACHAATSASPIRRCAMRRASPRHVEAAYRALWDAC